MEKRGQINAYEPWRRFGEAEIYAINLANGVTPFMKFFDGKAPDLPNDEDGEALYDLVMRWEKAKKIPRYGGGKPRIRVENEGGKTLLGIWIAVGGSGEDGAPDFLDKCLLLEDVEKVYAKRIEKAEVLWSNFAAWAEAKEGLKLPEPNLWLTPCEVA